jgi:ribonuclease R
LAKRQTLAPKLDKARLLALLAENPGATKRDLARLTGLKGSDRILLKRLLKELEKEGAIAGRSNRGFAKRCWPALSTGNPMMNRPPSM